MAPVTVVDHKGKVTYRERSRSTDGKTIPGAELLRLGRKSIDGWIYSDELSTHLRRSLSDAVREGYSFSERNVLVTGAGSGSIGCELVAKLLTAGAHVVVTSSSYSPTVTRFYQRLYAQHGGKGSRLVLVPFNQASIRDVHALIKYVYDEKDGLGMDLDYVVPFAAISENGRNLDNIDSRSELAHRVMLTNTMRLLGEVKQQKQARGILTRPAQVILPLSPNHGSFGSDGLYAESKLGLESLFEKFQSEDWAEYILVCGALIGWTRGTALMSENDIVSEDIERLGMRTYTQSEMALNVLALMSPHVLPLCTYEPLIADLSGGMGAVPALKDVTTTIRSSINTLSEERRATAREAVFDTPAMNVEPDPEPQANLEFAFAPLPDWETDVKPLSQALEGMVDLDRAVVVAGYAEVGPWGNSRVRWDMELNGELALESIIELAWTMGLIKAHNGIVAGEPFSGWLDKETGKPIADQAIRDKYEKFMLEHAGIRFMEPKKGSALWNGQEALHEIEIAKDHEPFEVSKEAALHLQRAHGEHMHAIPNEETGQVRVIIKKGAKIMIPKLLDTQHTVAGQIPTGWEPSIFGIPEEVISQVDPVTLYALVASAEAFQSAGVLDPYEFYQHLHVSDVANCVGSGFGGVTSIRKMFKGRYQDKPAANDILAESFISSGSAWINMLLLSAAGANKTPVGACATALESLDTAYDLIQAGKAKVCLVGGFDDMLKDISEEFANLKATINADEDVERGREPREMSRPATSTRKGFVESEGAGVQIVTSASVALEMGLPIYGVVALTRTAMDKAGRSIPAPGRGILGTAAQRQTKFDSPLMSMAYRKRALLHRKQQASDMRDLQLSYLEEEIAALKAQDPSADFESYRQQRIHNIDLDAKRDENDAINQYGNNFWVHDDRISPIRGALAVWGLTIDDIDFVSFHGTSTRANEKNESAVINEQFRHLGRTKGNLVPGIFQKSVTGHPKGPAGAWMLNGCLQAMHAGQIPGNRNADNIEDALEQYEYLVFPSKTIAKPAIKSFITESFGFGQKGAMMIGVNPKYLYATMKEDDFKAYEKKLKLRERKASRNFHESLSNNTVFQAKEHPPWAAAEEMKILLDPEARF
jgi:fatty acid synthase subunit alpha, fungi type